MSYFKNVDKDFYVTVNELVSRAAGVADAGVIDKDALVDYGRQLANLTQSDRDLFMNAFAAEIANKVKLSIDTARDYIAKLGFLVRGEVSPNGVIEMITHGFFETRAAAFVQLDGNTDPNQYVISKGEVAVNYYVEDKAYQIPVTLQYLELEGAFASPEAMNSFLQNKIRYAMNSNALAREAGRRGILGALIAELDAATAATGTEDCAQKYELVTLYNTTYGLTGTDALTTDNACYSAEFVKFAVNMITKVMRKLGDPSIKFNSEGWKTFTPEDSRQLVTNSILDSAIVSFKTTLSPEATDLGDHEVVSFWQEENDPLVFKYGGTYNADTETWTVPQSETSPVVAVLIDEFACGEFLCHEAVRITPFNARLESYNHWINVQTKYFRNKNANAVIFTLD